MVTALITFPTFSQCSWKWKFLKTIYPIFIFLFILKDVLLIYVHARNNPTNGIVIWNKNRTAMKNPTKKFRTRFNKDKLCVSVLFSDIYLSDVTREMIMMKLKHWTAVSSLFELIHLAWANFVRVCMFFLLKSCSLDKIGCTFVHVKFRNTKIAINEPVTLLDQFNIGR